MFNTLRHQREDSAILSTMTTESMVPTCLIPPSLAWRRLVERSMTAWKDLVKDPQNVEPNLRIAKEDLTECSSLEDFFCKASDSLMFWFFQRRDAFLLQPRMVKWNQEHLEQYIVVPAANGFVNRSDCFFVSHFWPTEQHPDPDGECLRLLQSEFATQAWSYIWVDWTCMPQDPRTEVEETYFIRSVETMPGIIRNCGFVWFYPPFKPRLWILFEVAEFMLTAEGASTSFQTHSDVRPFMDDINDMLRTGVRTVLEKRNYDCTYERDKAFVTSWLEIHVLLKRL